MRIRAGQDKSVWVEDAVDGWAVRARMVMQGSRFVVAELNVAPNKRATPPGGITQETVRRVPFGSFGPFVQATVSFAQQSGIGGLSDHVVSALKQQLGVLPTERPRPRRAKGYDDVYYAEVARDYVTLTGAGSKSPIKTMATARRVPVPRMRDMVRAARERGLLSLSTQGSAAGHLLPRAHELLGTKRRRARAS